MTFHDDTDGPCLSILSKSQSSGLLAIAFAGIISSLAVAIFLGLVARNYIRNIIDPPRPGGQWKLIRTHVDAYMLSLLFTDLLQGVGGILTMKWAIEQRTYCSAYCTAQGIIQQVGETGVALSTLAITFHTFITVFFHMRLPQWVWMATTAAIWSFLLLFVVIGYSTSPQSSPFYAPTPFWCWISNGHEASRLFGEYMWIWLAALINIILYIPLYFCVRGNIKVHPVSRRITFSFTNSRSATAAGEGVAIKDKNKEALKLIWYPISYTALVLPISIARWSSFPTSASAQTDELPITKTAVTVFIFGLSGLVNVLVFLTTRPHLLLFGPRRGLINTVPEEGKSTRTSPASYISSTTDTIPSADWKEVSRHWAPPSN